MAALPALRRPLNGGRGGLQYFPAAQYQAPVNKSGHFPCQAAQAGAGGRRRARFGAWMCRRAGGAAVRGACWAAGSCRFGRDGCVKQSNAGARPGLSSPQPPPESRSTPPPTKGACAAPQPRGVAGGRRPAPEAPFFPARSPSTRRAGATRIPRNFGAPGVRSPRPRPPGGRGRPGAEWCCGAETRACYLETQCAGVFLGASPARAARMKVLAASRSLLPAAPSPPSSVCGRPE